MRILLNFNLILLFSVLLLNCGGNSASVQEKSSNETIAKKEVKEEKNTMPGYKIGDKASDFKLKNIDGSMVSLADQADANGYIVVFTCNHCPYAVLYEDRLIALHNEMAAKGYPVIAINPNDPEVEPADSFDKMIIRAKEKEFPFVYLFDEKQEVYPKYGATKTPHVFLLDKDLSVIYIGSLDDSPRNPDSVEKEYVKMAVDALEKGEAADPATTKAIGCSIKKKA